MSDFGPIPRLEPDPDGLDFDGLQALGMELLQALSGARWTDYNPHDPGVTILDQLCYALTDLAYRTELPHEDYLAGPDGVIDLARHALHQPQDVFPTEPVTAQDWRRLLYDRIGQVEDAWVRDHEPVRGVPSGLLEIDFRLAGSVSVKGHRNAVKRSIRAVFAAHRGLCQDILQVRALKHKDCYLAGHIEIHSLRDPAAIYADIHFRSAACIASGLQLESYEQAAAAGVPPERLFSGPLTRHGRVSDGSQRDRRAPVSLARLVDVIRGIDGVQEVHALELRGADGATIDLTRPAPRGWVARLRFPDHAQPVPALRLHAMGKTDSMDEDVQPGTGHAARDLLGDARIALQKLEFESRAQRARPVVFERLTPAPAGSGRPLGSYYSIQHQFPAIYGINAHGVPPGAAPAVRAGARQLKAYLYVFEQVMANYLQGLADVGSLFSLDGLAQSTFAQVIDNTMLPDIEVLYTDDLARIRARLDGIRASFDRFEDRRERVLDVLLAMYGERYTQQALRKFAVYTDGPRALAEWLLENKLVWLRQIVTLSRKRGTAFRYDQPAWGTDNVSGAQRKIAVLLGLHETPHCRSLCAPLREHGLRIVPDPSAREYAAEAAGLLDRLDGQSRAPVLRVAETMFREAFLRSQVRVDGGRAIFSPAATPDAAWELGRIDAQAGASGRSRLDAFRARLRTLNMRCEGLHLVEHVLLRPRRDRQAFAPWVPDDYYPFQVSIVFPGWTARFADPEFRKFAEETVSLNLPAHVLPHFYWLGYVAMDDFEQRLQRWYAALRHASLAMQQDGGADPAPCLAALDQASLSLIMLLRREARDSTRRWI